MGYFSELDLKNKEEYIDRSYSGFEKNLLWRYEDLKNRYRELLNVGAPITDEVYFSKNDYRYAPVECFTTLSHVLRAMDIAKEDLEIKCDIIMSEDGSVERTDKEEDPNQLTMFEIVLLPTWFQIALAA